MLSIIILLTRFNLISIRPSVILAYLAILLPNSPLPLPSTIITKMQDQRARAIVRARLSGYEHGRYLEEDAKSQPTQYRKRVISSPDGMLDLYITYNLNSVISFFDADED